jgi:KRAB domain-containing zinc finger protein
VTKPEVIFRLEQGEEPWLLEEEFPSQSFAGELIHTAQINIRFIINYT